MLRALILFSFAVILAAPVRAESDAVSINVERLSTLDGGEIDLLSVGTEAIVDLSIENISNRPLLLSDVQLQALGGMSLYDGANDGIDNDLDGEVDGESERLIERDGKVRALPLGKEGVTIQPGERIRRQLQLKVEQNASPGTGVFLSAVAKYRFQDEGDAEVQSVRDTLAFNLERPFLEVPRKVAIAIQNRKPTEVTIDLSLPSGEYKELFLEGDLPANLAFVPAQGEFDAKRLGCAENAAAQGETGRIIMQLGKCIVPIGGVETSIKLLVIYADPLSGSVDSSKALEYERSPEIVLSIVNGTRRLARKRIAFEVSGSFVASTLTEQSVDLVTLSSEIEATYTIKNLGGSNVEDLRFKLDPDIIFDCGTVSVRVDGKNKIFDPYSCRTPLPILDSFDAGDEATLTLSMGLKNEAVFRGVSVSPGVLIDKANRETKLEPIILNFEKPKPPRLLIDLRDNDELVQREPLEPFDLNLSGNLVAGRYVAQISVLARLIDDETGRPLGPAPLVFETAILRHSDRRRTTKVPAKPNPYDADDIWARYDFELQSTAAANSARDWNLKVVGKIADETVIRDGALIELSTEIVTHGEQNVSSLDWRLIEIVEPSLELAMINATRLSEIKGPMGVICNKGRASAHKISPSLMIGSNDTEFRLVRGLERERVLEGQSTSMDEIAVGGPENASTLSVRAGECVAIIPGHEAVSAAFEDNSSLMALVSAQEYSGGPGEEGRQYPPLPSAQRVFAREQVLRRDPVPSITATQDGRVIRNLEFNAPQSGGPHILDLGLDSSAQLAWTVLEVDDDGALSVWENGTIVENAGAVRLKLESFLPQDAGSNWQDVTTIVARFTNAKGKAVLARQTLKTFASAPSVRPVEVQRVLAADRDCDGEIADETLQDAIAEHEKNLLPGECARVFLHYRYAADGDVEEISIADRLPSELEFLGVSEAAGTDEALISPAHDKNNRTLEWKIKSIISPGFEGHVSYDVRVAP